MNTKIDSLPHGPGHVAFIMDGNGRWAQQRGLPRYHGHRRGAAAIEGIIEKCANEKVAVVSFFAFSTENWQRPRAEIDFIFSFVREFLRKKLKHLIERDVRLMVSGDLAPLPEKCRSAVLEAVEQTCFNRGMTVNFCLNYGAIDEIRRACYLWTVRSVLSGKVDQPSREDLFECLYTRKLPEVDLLIRTGGQKRLSNFLLLQSAYAELYFSDTFWPDFSATELEQILIDYSQRARTYGTVVAKQ